jgi:heme-degrading monooxygenase HmoA
MYVRLVTGTIPPHKIDDSVQLWRETVLPSVRQQNGFIGVRLLVNRKNGGIATMGLWETEADFQATVAWNEKQVNRFADLFTTSPTLAGYELVMEV